MKILAFIQTWAEDKKLQTPYNSIVDAFERFGANIEVIRTNELLPHSDLYSFDRSFSEDKIIQYIKDTQPDFILSANNGGMTQKIRASISCPVVKWLFDDLPHLFFHDGLGQKSSAFVPGDIVVSYSSTLVDELLSQYPWLKGNIHYLPHATHYEFFQQFPWKHQYDVSFVGSCLEFRPLLHILTSCTNKNAEVAKRILKALDLLKEDYYCDFEKVVNDLSLETMLKEARLNWMSFKRLALNALSAQERMNGINALEGIQVALFGGQEWLESLLFSTRIAQSYRFFEQVKTQESLARIYQSSKISVDIPNLQNGVALSPRVIDVMASGSLLVTKYQKQSDIFKLFGSSFPVPMYKSFVEMKEICDHYLHHEVERQALVRKCNELVKTGYSFEDRVARIFDIVGKKTQKTGVVGSCSVLDTDQFRKHVMLQKGSSVIQRVVKALIKKYVPEGFRWKLAHFLVRKA